MITMMVGNAGSSKTANCVRIMMTDPLQRRYFSNILTKGVKNNNVIKPDMITNRTPILTMSGKPVIKNGEPLLKYTVNREFWEAQAKAGSLSVIIDEAHSILNARRAMLRSVQPVLDWISLLRRVLGSSESGYGSLYLVTQIERRLDIVAKEQTSRVMFHLCHFMKSCYQCGYSVQENNETSDPSYICPRCHIELRKHSHVSEVWEFRDYISFISWKYMGKEKTFFKHYYITDIEAVFPHYNTIQWENLLSEI